MKLMVVAHPDDETIFGGAQLLEGGWTVVCATNGKNPTRRREFEAVMRATQSEFEMWNFPDRQRHLLDEARLLAQLRSVVQSRPWSKVATHGAAGEYGHLHHMQIHRTMKTILSDFWVFDFTGAALPEMVWQTKLGLLGLYKSQRQVWNRFVPLVRNERLVKV